jgi:hypothetical protein
MGEISRYEDSGTSYDLTNRGCIGIIISFGSSPIKDDGMNDCCTAVQHYGCESASDELSVAVPEYRECDNDPV